MAISKSAEAFRTISEAAAELDVPQHVLRHWEEVFGQIRPMRRAGGRRYYRPVDIDVLRGVRVLLYDERYTTKGVQKIFKQQGVKYIAELGRLAAEGQSISLRPTPDDEDLVAASNKPNPFVKPKPYDATHQAANEAGAPPGLSPVQTRALLAKLQRIQSALDDVAIALDAIAVAGEDSE
ncbi:MAG: MerR family transcriptional regulator [Pseudomonadota bacterium]